MTSIEIGIIIAGIIGTVTVCAVRIIHQIQNSKCINIKCCGIECIRDVNVDLPEADTSDIQRPPSMTQSAQVTPPPPRPRLNSAGVSEIRKSFEKK